MDAMCVREEGAYVLLHFLLCSVVFSQGGQAAGQNFGAGADPDTIDRLREGMCAWVCMSLTCDKRAKQLKKEKSLFSLYKEGNYQFKKTGVSFNNHQICDHQLKHCLKGK